MPQSVTFQRNHFASTLSDVDARELFRTSVDYVEIETFTYCNRKCWFCPNAKIPQRQDKAGSEYMPQQLYDKIIGDLRSIWYCGRIQFGRYNEPLAEKDMIIDRIKCARANLTAAYLYAHTNGDFLTRDYLDELKAAGLNELKIQTYLGNNDEWNDQEIIDHMLYQLERLKLSIKKTITHACGIRYLYETDYPGMLVTIDARNFAAIGTDRGGLLPIQQDRPRIAPCLVPFNAMYIDWTGDVMPCCNLRSDVPEHKQYAVTDLSQGHSIFDAYVALHNWRLSLMRFGEKSGPCATCRYDEDQVGEESREELERVYQLAVQSTGSEK